VTEKRRELPWVPVEKEYEFHTEDGKKTLAELFDGARSVADARAGRRRVAASSLPAGLKSGRRWLFQVRGVGYL
jgi:hypothetical protein